MSIFNLISFYQSPSREKERIATEEDRRSERIAAMAASSAQLMGTSVESEEASIRMILGFLPKSTLRVVNRTPFNPRNIPVQ